MSASFEPADRLRVFEDGVRVKYERMTFSGGEVQVRLSRPIRRTALFCIVAHVHCSDDVMALLLLTDALRRAGAREIDLKLPYVPYGRQDRVCAPGESLALRVFCDLINAQRYSEVWVLDPHSDVIGALLDRLHVVHAADVLAELSAEVLPRDRTILVAPDAGALKKIDVISKRLLCPYIRADKTRDTTTGAITGTVVYSEHVGNCDLLVVDDICDGGRTFVELAAVLRPLTTGRLLLYISHGIFSRGPEVLTEHYDVVFVANSFLPSSAMPANFHPATY